MSKPTALGLELEWDDEMEFPIHPLDAIVISHGLDGNMDDVYVVMTTPNMGNVQAAGLLEYAKHWNDLLIMNDLVKHFNAYSEEE